MSQDTTPRAATTPGSTTRTVKAWRPLIRLLHWTIALSSTTLFISGEAEAKGAHLLVAPVLLVSVSLRVVLGFAGRPNERFARFFFRPAAMVEQLRSMLGWRERRPLGHNPLAGPVMFLMLASLLVSTLLGEFLVVADAKEASAAPLLAGVPAEVIDPVLILHSALAHGALGLVLLHLAGLAAHALRHKENIAWAMITGEKDVDELVVDLPGSKDTR
jgi:cytochrome b